MALLSHSPISASDPGLYMPIPTRPSRPQSAVPRLINDAHSPSIPLYSRLQGLKNPPRSESCRPTLHRSSSPSPFCLNENMAYIPKPEPFRANGKFNNNQTNSQTDNDAMVELLSIVGGLVVTTAAAKQQKEENMESDHDETSQLSDEAEQEPKFYEPSPFSEGPVARPSTPFVDVPKTSAPTVSQPKPKPSKPKLAPILIQRRPSFSMTDSPTAHSPNTGSIFPYSPITRAINPLHALKTPLVPVFSAFATSLPSAGPVLEKVPFRPPSPELRIVEEEQELEEEQIELAEPSTDKREVTELVMKRGRRMRSLSVGSTISKGYSLGLRFGQNI